MRDKAPSCPSVSVYDRRSMRVQKSNLVAMLLEAGEENAAVLLARSQSSDELEKTVSRRWADLVDDWMS
jgi:hypothetical protein